MFRYCQNQIEMKMFDSHYLVFYFATRYYHNTILYIQVIVWVAAITCYVRMQSQNESDFLETVIQDIAQTSAILSS